MRTLGPKRNAQLAAGTLLLMSGIYTLLVGAFLTFIVLFGFILGSVPLVASIVALYGARSLIRIEKIHLAILGPIALILASAFAIWSEWYFLYTQGLIVLPLSSASLILVMYSWNDLRERQAQKGNVRLLYDESHID